MPRSEWTPLVVAAATVGVVTAFLIWAVSTRFVGDDEPGDSKPLRSAPPQVTLWVGEVHPGLKGALTDVYGDTRPDHAHDARLNEQLGLEGDAALAFYRLLLFNTSTEERAYPLRSGGLAVVADADGPEALLHPLSGPPTLDGGTRFALEALGTLRDSVAVPAGSMANIVVAFDRRRDLSRAAGVETAEGTALAQRRMSRVMLRRLIENPRADWIQDL